VSCIILIIWPICEANLGSNFDHVALWSKNTIYQHIILQVNLCMMCISGHYIKYNRSLSNGISMPGTTRFHSWIMRERLLHQRWEGTLVRSRGDQSTRGSGKSDLKPTSAKYGCPEPVLREKKKQFCHSVAIIAVCICAVCCFLLLQFPLPSDFFCLGKLASAEI
jgi:hypothetical protein